MNYFSEGQCIPINIGGEAEIIGKIGEGGQGTVYKVRYMNKEYALKWYNGNIQNPEKFYANLENNIKKKAPSETFLWPEFLTVKSADSFGYLMKIRPERYSEFSDFLLAKVHFSSINAIINTALNITDAFRELHRNGFSYQDLNDGNFFIDKITGDVLICDNDNVAPYGENLGIAGKCRYMAPEVVRSLKQPDIHTDRFSLAVILFRLLFLDHPLEGKKTMCPCMTEQLEHKFYGTEPVFIYDPDDISNRPVRGVHANALRFWGIYPDFVQNMFIKAFSKDVMCGNSPRVTDNEWRNMFMQLRNCLIICSCGDETFINPETNSSVCFNCGMKIPKPPLLKTASYPVVLFPENKLYKCHTDIDSDDFKTVSGEVVRNIKNPAIWGLRNLSGYTWIAETFDGVQKEIKNNEVLVIMKTKSVKFKNLTAEIVI